jgi:N,N-dimethylformamidase
MKNTKQPTDLSRRQFLKTTGAGVAAVSAMGTPAPGQARAPEAIPPHRPLEVPGVHAYPLEHSVAAGETLELSVSNSVPYRLTICRLGLQVDDPSSDEVLADLGQWPANPQPIHPGSYVEVAKPLAEPLRAFTLECWVRPWDVTRRQGLITQADHAAAGGLFLGIAEGGAVEFRLGDGVSAAESPGHRSAPGALTRNRWHHVTATWDGDRKRLYLDGKPAGAWDFRGPVKLGALALRLGAGGKGGLADEFLDGDLAMPAIYARALSDAEVAERFSQQGLQPAKGPGLLACWPLSEERGERVSDVSGEGRHGRIVNHGTWMIGGPSFQPDVPRFGDYDPARDATRGHGLRFAADDLYDCRWSVTHRWKVPPSARSGIYVARMEFTYEEKPRVYHCTFVVRRAPQRKKAPILVVAATNTWRAYSGTPFAVVPAAQHVVWGTGGLRKEADGLPSYNLYRDHAAGQGCYQAGLRMPWPVAGPYVLYGGPTRYSHLARADRFPQAWLEEQGYEYDLISDLDLHRDPEILSGYKVFVVIGHNEYWSIEMYRGVEKYLQGGGNLLVLSGNTLFWRVSFNEDCTVMECRKADAAGNRVPVARRGEAWHSQDGKRGGMMRDCGWPGVHLIALDCLGFNSPSAPDQFGPYIIEQPDHFLFQRPEAVGLKKGDPIGFSAGRVVMANAHEFDIRPSTFKRLQQEPSPPGGVVPEDPPGIQLLANGQVFWKPGASAFDYFFRKFAPKENQGGEVIYWERPDGGRVFNAGAIGSGWVLHADQKWAAVVRNVLAHFGVPKTV